MTFSQDSLTDPNWWRQAAIYQIYPRSFADGNGDGIGDLQGIISHIDHFRALNLDAVWLSPFYPSALADGGYDVDDYRNIDPRIGTLDDFDCLVQALHAIHVKVIIDIVPNHSSDRHEWFRAAVASGKGSPERDHYIFRDGRGPHGELPPTDLPSIFGGSAWDRIIEPDGTPGQWYLHMFAKEQPDWNWDNPDVQQDFLETLRFWCDRGVDGFRVDAAHFLKKDLGTAFDALTNPFATTAELANGTTITFDDGKHPLWDRDELIEVYQAWRTVFNEYDPPRFAVAEASVKPHRQHVYAAPDSLGQIFNFGILSADFSSTSFHQVIADSLTSVVSSGSSLTWVLSNHDVVRHATRYGLDGITLGTAVPGAPETTIANDGKQWLLNGGNPADVDDIQGLRRARAATLFMLALPGSAYLYQGEELGLPEVGHIPDEYRQDPAFFRNREKEIGRDGCRVPLPWIADAPSFGFSSTDSVETHLPQPTWFSHYAVDVESRDPDSTLTLYRRALALRHELQCAEELEWQEVSDTVLSFRRPNGWCAITNFGTSPIALPPGTMILASSPMMGDMLPGESTAWLLA